MGSKKEVALDLIRELINLSDVIYDELHDEDGARIFVLHERLEELRDIVSKLDVCQCE